MEVFGELLPLAVTIALSPFPIVAVVLVLGTPRARGNGIAFALGWVLGLAVATAVIVGLADSASDPDGAASVAVSWTRIGVGVLLLVGATRKWRGRPRPGDEGARPGWMARIDTIEPLRALGLGATLGGVNPKNLALVFAGATIIVQAGLSPSEAAADAALFVAVASSTVVGAVVAHLVAGRRAERGLDAVKQFMLTNNDVIMMVIFLIFGAKLLGDGLAGISP